MLALFVFTAGLRGTAWASVVKDILVLGAVIFAGVAIPIRFFGSVPRDVPSIGAARIHRCSRFRWHRPARTPVVHLDRAALEAFGFYMGPHGMSAIYSARSPDAIRRNAMLLPLYQIFLALLIIAGFSAVMIVPGLKGTEVDQSFLLVVQREYPAWVLGLVASAGALAALVPASALLLGAASVITKNVAGDAFGFATGDAARTLLTRMLVVVVALLALGVWLVAQRTVVEFLLLYYNGISQFFPGVVAAFAWRRVTALAVGAGIAVGLLVAIPLAAMSIAPWGINAGLVGLLANAATLVAVTLATSARAAAR